MQGTMGGQARPLTDKDKLLIVMQEFKGRDNAVDSKTLAERMGKSNAEVRELYSDLVCAEVALLGSHPDKGFFMIVDDEDFELSTRHIESRIAVMSKRLKALNRMHEDRMTLSFEEAQSRLKIAMAITDKGDKCNEETA